VPQCRMGIFDDPHDSQTPGLKNSGTIIPAARGERRGVEIRKRRRTGPLAECRLSRRESPVLSQNEKRPPPQEGILAIANRNNT
jgi:hypothetical protein